MESCPARAMNHSTASKAFRKLIRECLQNHESITFNGLSPAGSKVNKAHYTYFILTCVRLKQRLRPPHKSGSSSTNSMHQGPEGLSPRAGAGATAQPLALLL